MTATNASDARLPRTTVDLDASVLRELKRRQEREHKPLGQLISELVAKALAADEVSVPEFRWVARDLEPRIDLEDKEAVSAILDGR
jgi:hypothetical protein